jgi:hypothetical protein
MGQKSLAIPILGGLISLGAAMAVTLVLHRIAHFDLLSFWAYLLPCGAMVFGMVGSVGFRLGARLVNHRIDSLLLGAMTLCTLIAVILVYVIGYATSFVYREAPANSIGASDWLFSVLANGRIAIGHHDSVLDVGQFGMALLLGKLGGVVVGALMAGWSWKKDPFCGSCKQYHARVHRRQLNFTSLEEFVGFSERLPQDPKARAVALASAVPPSKVWISKDGTVCLTVEHTECPTCREGLLCERVTMMMDSRPRPITELSQNTYLSNRPSRSPALPTIGRTQFGRKAT